MHTASGWRTNGKRPKRCDKLLSHCAWCKSRNLAATQNCLGQVTGIICSKQAVGAQMHCSYRTSILLHFSSRAVEKVCILFLNRASQLAYRCSQCLPTHLDIRRQHNCPGMCCFVPASIHHCSSEGHRYRCCFCTLQGNTANCRSALDYCTYTFSLSLSRTPVQAVRIFRRERHDAGAA